MDLSVHAERPDPGYGLGVTYHIQPRRGAPSRPGGSQARRSGTNEAKRAQRAQKRASDIQVVTFREEAEADIEAHRSGWKNAKHAEQWRTTLETYVYPIIGDVAVADVDTSMIVKILEPI